MKAIYPGSFDPITYGHVDIIERCSQKFDKVIVACLNNRAKDYLFSPSDRIEMIDEVFKDNKKVETDMFDGLLIDYANEIGADVIVRGLRAISDFEYEMQLSMFNKVLKPDLETFFLVSSDKYSFLSSSLVKEVASYKGDISSFVPPIVVKKLESKF